MAIPAGVQSTGQINAPSKELISRDPADYPACKFYMRSNENTGTAIEDYTGNMADGTLVYHVGAGANFFNTPNAFNFSGTHAVDAQYIIWNNPDFQHLMPGTKSMMISFDMTLSDPDTGIGDNLIHVGLPPATAGYYVNPSNFLSKYRIGFLARDDAGNQKSFTFGSSFDYSAQRTVGHIIWHREANNVWIEHWANGVLQVGRFTGADAGNTVGAITNPGSGPGARDMVIGTAIGGGSAVDQWITGLLHEMSIWIFDDGIPDTYLDAITQMNILKGGYGFPVALKGIA